MCSPIDKAADSTRVEDVEEEGGEVQSGVNQFQWIAAKGCSLHVWHTHPKLKSTERPTADNRFGDLD